MSRTEPLSLHLGVMSRTEPLSLRLGVSASCIVRSWVKVVALMETRLFAPMETGLFDIVCHRTTLCDARLRLFLRPWKTTPKALARLSATADSGPSQARNQLSRCFRCRGQFAGLARGPAAEGRRPAASGPRA
jgi:hypothetical protein